jgi:hypothetical protein
MSLYMWDSSDPIGTVHTWLSRVIEKSATFVVQILNDFFKSLDESGYLKQFDHVEFVADTGTHYRCTRPRRQNGSVLWSASGGRRSGSS